MSSVMGTTGATSSSSSLLRQRPTYLFTHNSNRDNTTNTLRNTEFTKSNRVHFNLRRNNILMMHKQQRPRDKFIMGSRSLTYQQRQDLKNSCPIISHMPFINLNSSVFVMNTSPFGLTDPRFGILHHFSPSRSYIWALFSLQSFNHTQCADFISLFELTLSNELYPTHVTSC